MMILVILLFDSMLNIFIEKAKEICLAGVSPHCRTYNCTAVHSLNEQALKLGTSKKEIVKVHIFFLFSQKVLFNTDKVILNTDKSHLHIVSMRKLNLLNHHTTLEPTQKCHNSSNNFGQIAAENRQCCQLLSMELQE